MPTTVPTSRLVQLNARLDRKLQTVDFAARRADGTYDDKDSGLKTAGKVAGAGAAVAGGLYLRGRAATGLRSPNPRSAVDTIKAGANALKGDAGSALAKGSAAMAPVLAKANAAGRSMKAGALIAKRRVAAKMPFGK